MESKLSPNSIKKPINQHTSTQLGLLFILIGTAAFVGNIFTVSFKNWWALFIFLPAGGMLYLGRALSNRENGRYQLISRLFCGIGLIVAVDAFMFLFNVDWGNWWPLSLISSGTALIMLGWGMADAAHTPYRYAFLSLCRAVGLSVVLLGIAFLFNQLTGWTLNGRFANWQWWGFFLLIPAGVMWRNGRQALANNSAPTTAIVLLNSASFTLAVFGIAELIHFRWQSAYNIIGICLIVGGAILLINARANQPSPSAKIEEKI